MDLIGLEKAIPKLTEALERLVDRVDIRLDEDIASLVNEAHGLLDRINGIVFTVTVSVPPRKPKQ
jgi:hypothetical protein